MNNEQLLNNKIMLKQYLFDKVNKSIPLKFNITENYSLFTNILLISDLVSNYDTFYTNCNTNTFPIIYNYKSKITELETLLKNFTNITRIAFVFDEAILKKHKFLDNLPFFTNNDLIEENIENLSSNFKLIINICNQLKVKNIDFLACNSLNYNDWKIFYNKLTTLTKKNNFSGVIIGASNNKTGNIKYGGDWILESINQDIKNIYFTNGIINYTETLSTIISTNGNIFIRQSGGSTEYKTDTVDWTIINFPATIVNTNILNTLTVYFTTNMTFDNTNQYFICGSENITFDGNYKGIKYIISINVSNYMGLIQNGTSISNGYNNITIQNIGVESSNLLNPADGWICQSYFNYNAINGIISNCYSTGDIGSNGGGICGYFTCYANSTNTSSISVINCYSTGNIGDYGGGVCGSDSGYVIDSGTSSVSISNCYSTGNIGNGSGGIVGTNYTNTTATNCYTLG